MHDGFHCKTRFIYLALKQVQVLTKLQLDVPYISNICSLRKYHFFSVDWWRLIFPVQLWSIMTIFAILYQVLCERTCNTKLIFTFFYLEQNMRLWRLIFDNVFYWHTDIVSPSLCILVTCFMLKPRSKWLEPIQCYMIMLVNRIMRGDDVIVLFLSNCAFHY